MLIATAVVAVVWTIALYPWLSLSYALPEQPWIEDTLRWIVFTGAAGAAIAWIAWTPAKTSWILCR